MLKGGSGVPTWLSSFFTDDGVAAASAWVSNLFSDARQDTSNSTGVKVNNNGTTCEIRFYGNDEIVFKYNGATVGGQKKNKKGKISAYGIKELKTFFGGNPDSLKIEFSF